MLFSVERMSSDDRAKPVALQTAAHLGVLIADTRRAQRLTLRELGERAGLAASAIHAVEHGRPASLATYAAIAVALKRDLRVDLVDVRGRTTTARAEDPVHAAMGEAFARRLASHGFEIAIDEPYQHYQFAGRADVLAWSVERRALLHVENRTRFPNLQDAVGAYNAKRHYVPPVMADRLGLRGGFDRVDHVIAGLWSAEVLHAVRIRSATFQAVCPDMATSFGEWWSGDLTVTGTSTSAFVLFDPAAAQPVDARRRAFVGLDAALVESLRPRYRGYAEAVRQLERLGRA